MNDQPQTLISERALGSACQASNVLLGKIMNAKNNCLIVGIITLLILATSRVYADENTASKKFDPEELKVEIRLKYSASALDIFYIDRALAVIRSLYGRIEIDQELVIKAETAVSSVRAVERVDDYEGSSSGRWNFPRWSGDGQPTEEYWDSVTAWSAKRLTMLAKQQAEQDGVEQPANAQESKSKGSEKLKPESEARSQ